MKTGAAIPAGKMGHGWPLGRVTMGRFSFRESMMQMSDVPQFLFNAVLLLVILISPSILYSFRWTFDDNVQYVSASRKFTVYIIAVTSNSPQAVELAMKSPLAQQQVHEWVKYPVVCVLRRLFGSPWASTGRSSDSGGVASKYKWAIWLVGKPDAVIIQNSNVNCSRIANLPKRLRYNPADEGVSILLYSRMWQEYVPVTDVRCWFMGPAAHSPE